jgi:phenylalanyl-tRNA synthetase beta chain
LAQVSGKNAEPFFELKGTLENLSESFNIKLNIQIPNDCPKILHSTRSAEIKIDNISIGYIGEINPQVLSAYKIKNRVAAAEIDMEKLFQFARKIKIYQPISKFPTVMRDISLLAPKSTTVAEILTGIKKFGGMLVKNIELFDIYQKDSENSFAFHIIFGSSERTLESRETETAMEKIISGLEKELKVEVRK